MRIAIKVNRGAETETVCEITKTEHGVNCFISGRFSRFQDETKAVDAAINSFAEVIAEFAQVCARGD